VTVGAITAGSTRIAEFLFAAWVVAPQPRGPCGYVGNPKGHVAVWHGWMRQVRITEVCAKEELL
jgi:hypothetical protein